MKNFKKVLALVLAMVMALSINVVAFAAETVQNADKAVTLNELGLFKGISSTEFVPDLESFSTREQAIIMLGRALGWEITAGAESSFEDVAPGEAQAYVAYAEANNIAKGTRTAHFGAKDIVTLREVATWVARQLGYGDGWDDNTVLIQSGIVSGNEIVSNGNKDLNRDGLVGAFYTTLTLENKNTGNTVIADLVEAGKVDAAKAEAAGLIVKEVPATALEVKSVNALSNTLVEVKLEEEVTQADVDAASFVIVKHNDTAVLEVVSETLQSDKKTVRLATASQEAYVAYNLTVAGATKAFVGLPVDNSKPTATAVVTDHQTVTVTFSKPVDVVTATNIANYSIDNNLVVLQAKLNNAGTVVTLTTSEQVVGTIYKITIENVTDLNGNKMDKMDTLFGGMAKDTSKPSATAVVTDNQTVTVTFSKKVDANTATNIANYKFDNNLVALKAELNDAGTVVTLTTSEQVVGTIYKITVEDVTDTLGNKMDKYETLFGGMAKDSSKPTATAVVTDNDKVTVNFSKRVDKALAENIANYSIDNGLVVLQAKLNSAGTQVVLTTSEQTVGTIYKITIQNVADAVGNVMEKYETLFGGMSKDTTPPSISTVVAAQNTLTITFSEKVSEATATNLLNYAFDGGLGYATKAELNDAGTVVTLTTANQTPGKIYNVTVYNVQDVNGNTINTTNNASKKSFVGVGTTSAASLKLQAVSIVNNNTIDLIFDRDLSNANRDDLAIAVSNLTTANQAGLEYTKVLQSNKQVVRVQFRNTASDNPAIFNAGVVYEATVTGPANLVTSNNANKKSFAGTNVANVAPQVSAVSPINSTAVKVYFSKPVKGISSGSFVIKQGNTTLSIASVSVNATQSVSEVTVNLSTALEQGKVYTLETVVGLTDAFGYIPVRITNSNGSTYLVNFGGTNVANVAPKLDVAVANDRHTITATFSEPVNNAATAAFTLTQGSTDLSANIIGREVSSDKTKVTLFLDAAALANGVEAGKVYTLTVDGTIVDLQNLAINADATSNDRKAVFGGTNVVNAKPEIAGVSINDANTVITVVFSEKVSGAIAMSSFDITGAGFTAGADTAVLSADGKTVTITLENALNEKEIASIKVSAAGAAIISDVTNQAPKTDAVQFGTK
ncbi:hypothetical protein EDC18_11015 [Natranaerovirga pectinivora]|uniref:SLH domain-containing protein n=1 Tax=Natranaerovirga pectinivora TaxID=682400 RepID=A0A4V2UZX5_9FIRM|nr:hypothetical protein [Natranaerovirga pectinivora]TCT12941.1 hypothetical protein EDC18_11015 [Natranaerovirga pectinivora]